MQLAPCFGETSISSVELPVAGVSIVSDELFVSSMFE